MENYYLAKWNCEKYNGFTLMTEEEWKKYESFLISHANPITLELVTNEKISYISGLELLSDISVAVLDEGAMLVIEKHFGWCDGHLEWSELFIEEDIEE
jgi:hypothetical protein